MQLSLRTIRPRLRVNLRRREAMIGYIFILPWILGLIFFNLGPILTSLYYSFTRYSVLRDPVWIGLDNYIKIFTDDRLFVIALINTVLFVALSVPLRIVFAFLLALLMNTKIRGSRWFRTIYYLPSIVPLVASAVLWLWIFHPRLGLANTFLNAIGMSSLPWLTDPAWSKPTLILISSWGVGQTMVILLAGLQDVPAELYEAATIDGAGVFARFFKVTLPMMTPVLFFTLVNGIIIGFQIFALPFVMTEGGPLNSTLFYNIYVYNNAFQYLKMGYASALVWILFVLVMGITYLVFGSAKHWVYYATD